MKKTLSVIYILLAVILSIPVLHAQIRPVNPANKKTATDASPFRKGIVLIKFTKAYENLLAARNTDAAYFDIPKLDSALQKLRVKSSKQEFAILFKPGFNQQSAANANRGLAAKKQPLVTPEILDQRHREFGFHLWYRLQFDSTIYLKLVLAKLQSLKGIVDIAEPVPVIKATSFNDPLYPYQNSLNNTGQFGGTPGADIKVEQAWGITTGDSNVVVAVTDEGIKIDHEDLDSSMWFGKGFNFVYGTANIVAANHGTHVAGTVAARSNNGKGISGIVGGNGTAASGARLMSCMISDPDDSFTGDVAASFVFAADNGAAINSNSWGGYSSAYYREWSFIDAVRYFSKYGGGAGTKGGITVWAGGNANFQISGSNSSYDVNNNIRVAATDNMDKKAGFSSYGSYIDISAPGTFVLSSVVDSVNGYVYDYYSGTSMAAPTVSGVMALIASVAPGRFTADEVTGIVLSTADNIDTLNPGYEGKLGSGRVNAYRAVLKAQQMAAQPLLDTVSNTSVSRTCNGYNVSFTKNAANNNVMIALGLSRKFDLPYGRVYNVGDSIGKGAKVVYKGPASTVAITQILKDSARHYFKIWSMNGSNYSGGTVIHADSSFHTLRSPSATQGADNVAIRFGKVCPNSDIMVVVNSLPQFGKPSGDLSAGNTVAGGGTVLYKGAASGFTHSGLTSGTYYYALYPVIGTEYGVAKYLGGYCFSVTGVPLPLKTSFESPDVPPHFALFTPGQRGFGWDIINNGIGSTGSGYAYANNSLNYLPEAFGEVSYLQTASLNVTASDSVICRFAHALPSYDTAFLQSIGLDYTQYLDTLTVLVSADCGQTWQTAWKKWAYELTTMDAFVAEAPTSPADWAQNKVNLTGFIPSGTGSIMVAFKNTNRGGENIYLDDINIYKVKFTDAGIAVILYPTTDACSSPFTPKLVLTNFGINPLTSATIRYAIDGGAVQSFNWSGNKLYEQGDTITLPATTATPGNHTLTVYTVLPNNLADEITSNDTATTNFRVLVPVALAANTTSTESFENPVFVPYQWRLAEPDKAFNWVRISPDITQGFVAASDSSAAFVNTFDNPRIGYTLDLYSPAYNTGNADTVRLTFSRAAADYTGNGATTDKLDVLLTTDCGSTFTPVYSKTGAALTTSPVTSFFYPTSPAEWKTDTVDISNMVRNAGEYRFVFRVTNDNNNNIFLDNVQVQSKQAGVILPLDLLSFTGKAVGTNKAQLAWRTANEIKTQYFELQRSTDGRSFKPILLVHAKGNAQSTTDYGFTDGNLLPGQYYYRLRIEDWDGKQSYSQVVTVVLKNNDVVTVYPVPAKDAVWINSNNIAMIGKNMQLTDIQGRVLKTISISQLPQHLDITILAAGTYLLKLPDNTTIKVIKR